MEASTRFACDPKKINLYEGGLMVHSRKIESILELESPEASAILSGVGCLLAEAETNGGMKVIGILGSIRNYLCRRRSGNVFVAR
jgi:hypothetical protein